MAKPDCDDGWVKLAHELLAALSCAGFNKWESVVIREVIHQVYGPSKKREANLSPTDIATRVGTYKESIVRAIRSLKVAGVIRETETGVRFIKDYETWNWNGEPRLTARERAYCRACIPCNASTKDGNKSVPNASTKDGNESVPHINETGERIGSPINETGERIGSPAGTNPFPGGNESVPQAHYVERTALRSIENGEEECEKFTPAHTREDFLTGRVGEEHALFCRVVEDLAGFKETKYLAESLIMYADTPEIRGYPSWRLFVASRVVQRPNRGKTWDTFCRAAFNASPEEYDRLRKGPPNGTGESTTSRPGGRSLPPERKATAEDEARAARDMAAYLARNGSRPRPTT